MPPKTLEKRRAYRLRFKAEHPDYDAVMHRKYYEACPLKVMLRSAKARARKCSLEFSITLADLELPAICPMLGIPIKVGTGSANANSPSLDRIDPAKGYIPGNVKIISHRANTIKSNASADELRKVAEYVDRYLRLN